MLGGALALGTAAFFDPMLIAVPGYIEAMGALALGGISMEAGAVANALTSNRGMNITTRQAASARQIIYGQQRVGGVEIYRSTTGSHHDQFNYVIVLAGHVIDSIVNLYLDGRQVHWQVGSVGNVTRNGINFGGTCDSNTYTGPNGVQYNFGGGVYCEACFGDQTNQPNTTPGGGFNTGLYANDPVWGPSAEGIPYVGGCAYVYLKVEYNTNNFPAEPEIRCTVNGKNNIYDPRTGTSGFTTNWALICADVLTDTQFGLGDNTVNQDQLIAAANVCDEQVTLAEGGTEARYNCNYHYDTSVAPGDALAAMMPAAAGRLSRIGGEWYLWPAYWQGPSFTFDGNALIGPMQWSPYRPYRELINRVNGTYIAPTYPYNTTGNLYDQNGFYNGTIENNFPYAFQPTNYPQYACDVAHGYSTDQYLTADGGHQLPKELSLQSVLSVAQAQRVAKIALLRNRQQGSGTFPMNLAAWSMQPLDVMQFTFAQNGWTEKNLEVVGVNFTIADAGDGVQSVRCSMQVQETDASVYEWSIVEELTVYDVPATPTQTPYTPAPPTGMTLTSGAATALVTLDGVVHPRIEVQWVAPLDILTKQIQVQYAYVSNPTLWIDVGLVDVANTLTYIPGVIAGQQCNVRIRSLRANGATSVWEEIDGYTVSMTLSVIGILALDPGSLIAEAYSNGTASIIVSGFTATIGNASVAVLPSGSVTLIGLNQSQLYYVYYIDPAFTGGTITPIATQNTADFVNKIGYFLIDSIVTPYAPATGTSSRYTPSNYSDTGTRTTRNATNAYDGNTSTSAVVSGSYKYLAGGADPLVSYGDCLYQGFPSMVTTAATTLSVIASFSSLGGAEATITGSIGSSSTVMIDSTVNFASTTYTLSIPTGTDISSVSVECVVSTGTIGTTMQTGNLYVSEIYIQ